jgi:diguanylate cyclase (GGDEF)-like protein
MSAPIPGSSPPPGGETPRGSSATHADLRRLAFRDHLTGLPNRAALAERMRRALSRARQNGNGAGLLFVDLDGFKLVNDTLGHPAGDRLLQFVAGRLSNLGGPQCFLARHGGDEFMVLCEDLDRDPQVASAQALAIAEELRGRMGEPFTVANCTFEISASIGVSVYPHDAADADSLIQHADQAMYSAKRAGRGGCAVFDGSERHSLAELETTLRVRRALEQGQLELFYQPVVEVADGYGLGGLEALLRWRDPDRGLVNPGSFLPYLADSPLVEEIGEWVFAEVCRQLARWRRSGFAPRVSFNIPARQLRRPGFAEFIERTAQAEGADLTRIAAEITETGTVDLSTVVPTLRALQDAGMLLSLDDFGTGYSSLSRLRDMPFSLLKTDLTFMRGIPHDASAVELMEGIISLGRTLGMVVIVEGVETAEQLDTLLDVGCRVAQGYYLGRPAPADEIEAAWANVRRSSHVA